MVLKGINLTNLSTTSGIYVYGLWNFTHGKYHYILYFKIYLYQDIKQ